MGSISLLDHNVGDSHPQEDNLVERKGRRSLITASYEARREASAGAGSWAVVQAQTAGPVLCPPTGPPSPWLPILSPTWETAE